MLKETKRNYTLKALEEWFSCLADVWEEAFSEVDLNEGRRLYRGGHVREVSLEERTLVVHSKLDGESIYAVVDVEEGSFSVRCSRDGSDCGHALGIAGLYEVEELLGEHIEFLALSPEPRKQKQEQESEQKPACEVCQEEPPAPKVPEVEARDLRLKFDVHGDALVFTAWWHSDKGREQAYGPTTEAVQCSQERERLLKLSTQARRAHFRFCNEQVNFNFRLEDGEKVLQFVRNAWPRWKKRFACDYSEAARPVFEGVQTLDLEAEVQSLNEEGMQLAWHAQAGDRALDQRNLRRIALLGEGTRLLPGIGLVEVRANQVESLRRWQEDGLEGKPLPSYMVLSLFTDQAMKVRLCEEAQAWNERFAQVGSNGALPEFLRDYQRDGIRWLHHRLHCGTHPLLADEMGLGKTVQILSLLATTSEGEPNLVVCPASVIPVWQNELAHFFPGKESRVIRADCLPEAGDQIDLWICSYAQLRRLRESLVKTVFAYVVLDEAHFIKNPETRTTQSACALKSRYRIAVTGTPVENRSRDLWSIYRFLMPGLLGSLRRFEQRVDSAEGSGGERLRQQVAPLMLRRRVEEVLEELPEKTETALYCELSERQKEFYREAYSGGLECLRQNDAGDKSQMGRVLQVLTRMRQVCCDPGLLPGVELGWQHSGKLVALADKLAELFEVGKRVVVFSQYVSLLERIGQMLAETYPTVPRYELTGKTRDRDQPVQAFQSSEGAAIMLVSLRAGGTGITLHRASYAFLMDPWWNPAVEAQAIARLHRMGQREAVMVYRLLTAGTLEERIEQLKQSKRELFDSVVEEASTLSVVSAEAGGLEALSKLAGASS